MKKLDIRRALREHHMTQTQLCERAGLRTQSIISLINGNPTVAKLTQVAEGIGCDITDLFFSPTPTLPKGEGAEQNAPASEGADLFSQTAEQGKAEEQPVQTVAFCPHCGAKVRVGVVLLPE